MNVEAVQRLIDLLDGTGPYAERSEPLKFDINDWIDTNEEHYDLLRPTAADNGASARAILEGSCGTAACACGHAGMDPWFIERGFSLNKFGTPMYKRPGNVFLEKDVYAAADFFDIEFAEADWLFMPWSYYSSRGKPTAQDVSARLKHLLRSKADEK